MPIYEYLCEACGTLTERMQKISDPGPRTCPECGSRKIAKLVSRTSFQLKGGGWYADLYASPRPGDQKKGTHGKKETGGEGKAEPAKAEPAKAAAEPAPARPEGKASRPGKARKGR